VGQFPQAHGTNYPVIVLGDAFAAEIVTAGGTTRDRFALAVIETPL
jgi:hypothetical protein